MTQLVHHQQPTLCILTERLPCLRTVQEVVYFSNYSRIRKEWSFGPISLEEEIIEHLYEVLWFGDASWTLHSKCAYNSDSLRP